MGGQTLDEIGLKHGTDKASSDHDYLRFYESFLEGKRLSELSILEVGVFNCQSLKTWEEYFPNGRIVGVDITQGAKRFERGRIAIEIADQSDIQQLTDVAVKHGPFDLVVEDGSHLCEHQITTLRTLFPFVRDEGIYIVEDLQTNFGRMLEDYRGVSSTTCVEYLKKWLDLRVARRARPRVRVGRRRVALADEGVHHRVEAAAGAPHVERLLLEVVERVVRTNGRLSHVGRIRERNVRVSV